MTRSTLEPLVDADRPSSASIGASQRVSSVSPFPGCGSGIPSAIPCGRRAITRTLGAVGITQVLSLAITFVTTIVVSRWLEPTGRGAFILALLIVQTVTLLLDFGLPGTTMTFLLRREYPVQSIVCNSFTLALARICLSLITVSAVWLSWGKFHVMGRHGLLLVAGICAADLLLLLIKNVLFGEGHMRRWASLEIGVAASFMLLIGTSWVFSIGGGALYVLTLYLAVRLVGLVFAAAAIRRLVRPRLRFERPVIRAMLKFGFRNMLNNITWALGPRVDMYVVSATLPAAALGIYSVATGMADKMLSVMYTIPTGLYRFQATTDNADHRLEKLSARALRISIVLGLAMTVGVLALASLVIPFFFGSAYTPAVAPLMILSMSAVIAIGFHIFGGYITGYLMKPEIRAGFGVLLVVVNAGANLLLVPRLGIIGAALATLLSTVVVFVPFAWYFSRLTGLTIRELLLPGRQDIRTIIGSLRKAIDDCRLKIVGTAKTQGTQRETQ